MMSDWRLDNAEGLRGQRLRRKTWTKWSDQWDHDHCNGCMAKFAEYDGPHIQKEGYTSCEEYSHGANYAWVCVQCFDELHEQMGWTVANEGPLLESDR
jgi:hypothetical protein